MTPQAALELMAKLVCTTNGWDSPSAEVWTDRLTRLEDEHAAATAIEQLVDTWNLAIRPPWGRLLEHYRAAGRANEPAPKFIRRGSDLSFEQYMDLLRGKALMGDSDAARDLESWKHHVSSSSSWLKVIGGIQA